MLDKYHSQNHAARTIVVQDANGQSHTLEGIDDTLYDCIQLGDRVVKRPGTRQAVVNGDKVELFEPRRWIVFGK